MLCDDFLLRICGTFGSYLVAGADGGIKGKRLLKRQNPENKIQGPLVFRHQGVEENQHPAKAVVVTAIDQFFPGVFSSFFFEAEVSPPITVLMAC